MTTTKSFPVKRGLQGINSLAILLNSTATKGQWHFASGSQFWQPVIDIDFDDASDADTAWTKYQASQG